MGMSASSRSIHFQLRPKLHRCTYRSRGLSIGAPNSKVPHLSGRAGMFLTTSCQSMPTKMAGTIGGVSLPLEPSTLQAKTTRRTATLLPLCEQQERTAVWDGSSFTSQFACALPAAPASSLGPTRSAAHESERLTMLVQIDWAATGLALAGISRMVARRLGGRPVT